jgi:hypothetical protein
MFTLWDVRKLTATAKEFTPFMNWPGWFEAFNLQAFRSLRCTHREPDAQAWVPFLAEGFREGKAVRRKKLVRLAALRTCCLNETPQFRAAWWYVIDDSLDKLLRVASEGGWSDFPGYDGEVESERLRTDIDSVRAGLARKVYLPTDAERVAFANLVRRQQADWDSGRERREEDTRRQRAREDWEFEEHFRRTWQQHGWGSPPQSATTGPSWWTVLGVPASADRETVEKAYRAMSFRFHPDRGGDPKRMQEINAAYDQFRRCG